MKRKAIGGGVYEDEGGGYWARPWVNRRRTWRKIKATREREAFKEASNTNFESREGTFRELSDEYHKAGCPNKRLEERPEKFNAIEKIRLDMLNQYFGRNRPEEIKMPLLLSYKVWRVRKVKKGTGERTVDLDLNTLSNVLNYGVAIGRLEINYIRGGRPRFRRKSDIKHSRVRAPVDADEIHKIVSHFFAQTVSEALGWQALFACMTGCRTSELLRLRADAKHQGQPGYIEGGHLFLRRRSKHGVNPFILITEEFADMLRCFWNWHRERYPESPWMFPGWCKGKPLTSGALRYGMRRACEALGLPRRSPHGLRSYYVSKRRADGISDAQVAAEIGDKTVALIPETYGELPANWTGGNKLSFLPTTGLPAWRKWDSSENKLVHLKSGLKSGLNGK